MWFPWTALGRASPKLGLGCRSTEDAWNVGKLQRRYSSFVPLRWWNAVMRDQVDIDEIRQKLAEMLTWTSCRRRVWAVLAKGAIFETGLYFGAPNRAVNALRAQVSSLLMEQRGKATFTASGESMLNRQLGLLLSWETRTCCEQKHFGSAHGNVLPEVPRLMLTLPWGRVGSKQGFGCKNFTGWGGSTLLSESRDTPDVNNSTQH